MRQEITEKTITISVSKLWAVVSGIALGTAFVVVAYYGLKAEIQKVYTDLHTEIEVLKGRVGVLEKVQDSRDN